MITSEQLRQKLQDGCEGAGSQRQWALANGLSLAYVNDVFNGNREPAEKIAKALGYKKVQGWIKKPATK